MRKPGTLVTLIGQSGSGKTTQMRELVAESGIRQSPNLTTREPRASDLPQEYTYLGARRYAELLAQPGRLLWDVSAGNGARYSKDICNVIEAFTDGANVYVQSLIPSKAHQLVKRYGPEQVRTVFLPHPGDDVLLARMAERGDSPEGANQRLRTENAEGWLEQSLAIEGLYVLTAQNIAARHEELLGFINA